MNNEINLVQISINGDICHVTMHDIQLIVDTMEINDSNLISEPYAVWLEKGIDPVKVVKVLCIIKHYDDAREVVMANMRVMADFSDKEVITIMRNALTDDDIDQLYGRNPETEFHISDAAYIYNHLVKNKLQLGGTSYKLDNDRMLDALDVLLENKLIVCAFVDIIYHTLTSNELARVKSLFMKNQVFFNTRLTFSLFLKHMNYFKDDFETESDRMLTIYNALFQLYSYRIESGEFKNDTKPMEVYLYENLKMILSDINNYNDLYVKTIPLTASTLLALHKHGCITNREMLRGVLHSNFNHRMNTIHCIEPMVIINPRHDNGLDLICEVQDYVNHDKVNSVKLLDYLRYTSLNRFLNIKGPSPLFEASMTAVLWDGNVYFGIDKFTPIEFENLEFINKLMSSDISEIDELTNDVCDIISMYDFINANIKTHN